jgi:hypothetical protein
VNTLNRYLRLQLLDLSRGIACAEQLHAITQLAALRDDLAVASRVAQHALLREELP